MQINFNFFLLGLILPILFSCANKTTEPDNNTDLPSKPSLILADTSATGNHIIYWTLSRNANSYILEEDIDPSFSNSTLVYSGVDTTLRITGKSFGNVFYYRVKANNDLGSSEWSETQSITVVDKPAPNIIASPTNLVFGETFLDSSKSLPFQIQNNGNAPLTISVLETTNDNFTTTISTPFTVPPSSNQTVDVIYTPKVEGSMKGKITIQNNDIDDYAPVIELNGIGKIPAPQTIAVAIDSLIFASYSRIGFVDRTFFVKNDGEIKLQVLNMSFNSGDFSVTGNTAFTIPPLDSQGVMTRFTSSSVGVKNATLIIESDDPANPNFQIPVRGTVTTQMIFAGTDDGVFRSLDIGSTWKRVDFYLSLSRITAFSINRSNNYLVAGTYGDGVFISTDNGETWKSTSLKKPNLTDIGINSVGVIYVGYGVTTGSQGGVWRSSDNGLNWSPTNLQNQPIRPLAINSKDHIFAGTSSLGRGKIFKSIDGGDSWTEGNLPNKEIKSLAINMSDHIFAGIFETGVYRSTDDGANWVPVNSTIENITVDVLGVNPVNSSLFASTGNGVYRSTNNGDVWENIGLAKIVAFAFNSSGQVLAGAFGDGIFFSSDNGQSWETRNVGLENIFVLSLIVGE